MDKGKGSSCALGNSNPNGPYAARHKITGEPLNPNHWDYLK